MRRVVWLALLAAFAVILWWLMSESDAVSANGNNIEPTIAPVASSGTNAQSSNDAVPPILPTTFPGETPAAPEARKLLLRGNIDYAPGSVRAPGKACTVTARKVGDLGGTGRQIHGFSRIAAAAEPLAGKAVLDSIPGTFSIEVTEEAVYRISITIDGAFDSWDWIMSPRDAASDIPLLLADSVTLHLVGGLPEHVASVEAVSNRSESSEHRAAVREAERTFRIAGPVMMPATLRVRSAGPKPIAVDLETREREVWFSVADLRILRVRVLDAYDKRPVEGALVQLEAPMSFGPDQEPVHTDAEGRAGVPFLASPSTGGEYISGQLAVAAAGHASISRALSVNVAKELEILLLREGQPGGMVVDDKGLGRAGVHVTLANSGRMLMRGVTAADGRFTLHPCNIAPPAFDRNTPPRDLMFAPGLALLFPSPGGGLAAQVLTDWPALADGRSVVQPRTQQLRVRALLATDGTPLKGATVQLCPALNDQALTSLADPVERIANEAGEAVFDVLADAQWCVCVTGEGFADDLWQPLRIVNDCATVTVQRWPKCEVQFIDHAGAPVRNLHVCLTDAARSTTCVTDADGRIALPPGPPDRGHLWSIEDQGFLPAPAMPYELKAMSSTQVIMLDEAIEVALADEHGPSATRRPGLRALLLARRQDGMMDSLGNVSGSHGDRSSPNLQLSRHADALWVLAAGCHAERHTPRDAPSAGVWRVPMPGRAGPVLVAKADEERARTCGGGQLELEFHRFLEPELAGCLVWSSSFKPLGHAIPIGIDGAFRTPQLVPGKYKLVLRSATGTGVRHRIITISGDATEQQFH